MIAVVYVTNLWLSLAADLTQLQTFPYLSANSSAPKIQVSTKLYAGGNYRVVRQRGRQSTQQFTLLCCTAAQRQLIEFDWLGELLVVRDDRGRKYFGVYADPQVTEHPYNDECDITITMQEITKSESV